MELCFLQSLRRRRRKDLCSLTVALNGIDDSFLSNCFFTGTRLIRCADKKQLSVSSSEEALAASPESVLNTLTQMLESK